MISKEKKQLFLQYAAGITASLVGAGYGASMSWTSPALPYLTSENSSLPVSKEQSDWIASLLLVGFLLGYLINPFFINRISRKKTLLAFTGPQIISWIMIILAKDCIIIYIARIIGGIGYGGGCCALAVYLSEIGNKNNRGIFLVLLPLSINSGFLFEMILGACFSYNSMNIALLLLPVTFILIFFFMPDSSYFREKNNESKDDVKMQTLLNPQESEIIDKTDKNYTFNQVEGFYTSTLKFKESNLWKLIAFRNNRKALMIITLLTIHISFSGDTYLVNFAQQILSFSRFSLSAEKSAIFLPAVRIIASVVSILLVERIKRKILFLFTGISGSIAMGLVGIFFFLENQNLDVSFFRWIPLAGTSVYEFMILLGSINLYYIFLGELFTPDVVGTAVTICKIIFTSSSFLSIVRFQVIFEFLGVQMTFFVFAIFGTFMTCIIFIITPETKGKRLEEIQVLLKSKKMFYI